MRNILYLKCDAGISGDMFAGMMLDLGASEEVLRETLDSIGMEGYSLKIRKVMEKGIPATDFDVVLDEEYMEQLRSIGYVRKFSEILEMIEASGASREVKELAKKIFYIDAEAEAKAHGVAVEDVTFHEIGAVDSVVDIMTAAICLYNLEIEEVIIDKIAEGNGTIQCRCGTLNVPVPAVVNIADKYDLELHKTEVEGEMITPTGAAIAAAIRTDRKVPNKYKVLARGAGTGKRNYPHPRVLEGSILAC